MANGVGDDELRSGACRERAEEGESERGGQRDRGGAEEKARGAGVGMIMWESGRGSRGVCGVA